MRTLETSLSKSFPIPTQAMQIRAMPSLVVHHRFKEERCSGKALMKTLNFKTSWTLLSTNQYLKRNNSFKLMVLNQAQVRQSSLHLRKTFPCLVAQCKTAKWCSEYPKSQLSPNKRSCIQVGTLKKTFLNHSLRQVRMSSPQLLVT